MSFTEFSAPGKGYDIHREAGFHANISLNQLFKEAVSRVVEAGHPGIIVRCESLPRMKGHIDQMRAFFEMLIRFVTEPLPGASKLFLHISCEEMSGPAPDEEGQRHYHIRFHTNLSAGAEWKNRHSAELSRCQQIISAHGGTFMVNNINNAGYLFSITLPGKLQ